MKNIIEFYGGECPDCLAISSDVNRVEQEHEIEIEKLEVWHNEENKAKMEALKNLYDKECEGNFVVPSFYDPERHRLVCMPRSYEELKNWVFA